MPYIDVDKKKIDIIECKEAEINKQENLIEQLKNDINMKYDLIHKLEEHIECQKEEIEQWKEEANRYQNLYCESCNDILEVKSKAMKEFWEQLRKAIENMINENKKKKDWDSMYPFSLYGVEDILKVGDNLIKEMTEAQE